MKFISLFLILISIASCNSAREIKGIQKAEDFFYQYYENQAAQRKDSNSYLYTIQWDSYSLASDIWYDQGRINGFRPADPILSLGVSYDKEKLCNSEYVFCTDEKYTTAYLRKDRNSSPLPPGSKFTLVGKVFKEGDKLVLVDIISLTAQNKTLKEDICKRGKIHENEFKIGDLVYFTNDTSFIARSNDDHTFTFAYGSHYNIQDGEDYKILEMTEGELKAGENKYGTQRFFKIKNDLWVSPDKEIIPSVTKSCDLIDRIGIQAMRVQLREGARLKFNGEEITKDHPDFKIGIKCIKQRLGIVECGWANQFHALLPIRYLDKERYFFSDIDFINNFEIYTEKHVVKTSKKTTGESASYYENIAEDLFNAGKMKDAFLNFDKACRLGSAKACYNNGVTLTQELKLQEEGMNYYFRSCELNFALACYNIAGIQLKGDLSSRFEAQLNFGKACKLGLKKSCTTESRLKKLFIEKKASISYEKLFEALFPEIIQEMKNKGQFEGVHNGPRT